MRKPVLALTIAAMLALNFAATTVDDKDDSGLVNKPMPEFSVPAFDGSEFHSAELQGRVALVVFWFPT